MAVTASTGPLWAELERARVAATTVMMAATMPTAIAITFFTAPPISTPARSSL